ncbi:MAG: hypothetical protein WCO02_14420 [Bacteroidota bacterium]
MKVKLVALLLLAFSFAAGAQESTKTADSFSFKMSTVFGKNHGKCNIPLGYLLKAVLLTPGSDITMCSFQASVLALFLIITGPWECR